MANAPGPIAWGGTNAYEAYMGRWSRPIAQAFVDWFAAPKAGRWLDVGCGTGALTTAVLDAADPDEVVGIDPSADFLATATARITDPRARFEAGDARALPVDSGSFDAVVSGLVLNHIPDPAPAAAEMVRTTRPGGVVGAYVWDYDGEMLMVRYFWEAAAATAPDATRYDPRGGGGYQICKPEPFAALFRAAGLGDVTVSAIDLPMRFRDFDDFWLPHIMPGPGPTQRFVATLDDDRKVALREQLRGMLHAKADGTIDLIGRAWAAWGTKPTD